MDKSSVTVSPVSATVPGARRRWLAVLAIVLSAGLALGSCAREPETIQPTDPPVTVDPDVEVEKSAAPEAPEPPPVWPLTGVAGEIVDRPVLGIKIETTRPARPQTGLDSADIVWEELIEGGETRLLAMFHSTLPSEVGPIRSLRPMDGDIVAPTGGMLAFSGGQAGFIQEVRSTGVQLISEDSGGSGFYRVSFRRAPYNLYGDPNVMLSVADSSRNVTPSAMFTFADDAPHASAVTGGTDASQIITRFPAQKVTWDWDGSRWMRSMADAPHTVDSGAQLGAENVIVLRVNIRDTGTRDPAGTAVYETILVDSGEALVATGGRTISGTWSKTGSQEPIVLTDATGQVITLAPGQTFVELLPNSGGTLTVS